jgi:hypothetical protein
MFDDGLKFATNGDAVSLELFSVDLQLVIDMQRGYAVFAKNPDCRQQQRG